jgi:pimeloyl-ACP methyl ester carboxylesterase
MTTAPTMTEQFCDVGRGIRLCYDTFGDRTATPLLLVMGLGMQMIGWDEDFCQELADRGFHVVRFDNRDVGRSTHPTLRPPTNAQLLRRRVPDGQYSLTDMATDAGELITRLELAPAHIVGVSMGGMIAQTLAAASPAAIRSLVSIMSSTGSRRRGQPALKIYPYFVSRPPRDRAAYVERSARLFNAIGSPTFPPSKQDIRDRAARHWDRDHDPHGVARQLGAIAASGNRTHALRTITTPTLVIHGTRDKMVAPSGGRATARAIPSAKLLTIDGLGHDLPRGAWPLILDAIVDHAHRADGATQ